MSVYYNERAVLEWLSRCPSITPSSRPAQIPPLPLNTQTNRPLLKHKVSSESNCSICLSGEIRESTALIPFSIGAKSGRPAIHQSNTHKSDQSKISNDSSCLPQPKNSTLHQSSLVHEMKTKTTFSLFLLQSFFIFTSKIIPWRREHKINSMI